MIDFLELLSDYPLQIAVIASIIGAYLWPIIGRFIRNLFVRIRYPNVKRGYCSENLRIESFSSVAFERNGDPILLERMWIRNFKNISDIDLLFTEESQLEGNWSCIAGINGAGKTTVLQAISIILMGERLVTELGRERLRRFLRRHKGATHKAEIEAVVRQGNRRCRLYLPLDENGVDNSKLLSHKDYHLMSTVWKLLGDQLVVSYGASRSLSDSLDNRYSNVSRAVQRHMTLFDPLSQIANVEAVIGEKSEISVKVVRVLSNLIRETLSDKSIGLLPVIRDSGITFKQRTASVQAIDLPDGYKSTLAWFADMCSTWISATVPSGRKGDDPRAITGIVLVDEIGLHFHPSLERSIISMLRRVLPNVQFIVTTHSPLVLSSFDRSEIILFDKDADGGLRYLDRQIFGFTTNEVYEWLMGTIPQSQVMEELLRTRDEDSSVYLYQSPQTNELEATEIQNRRRQLLRELGLFKGKYEKN